MNNAATKPLILSVSQLTQAIKLQLESTYPNVWVKGEISNLKLQTSGHLYFSLKDADASIACAAFRQDAQKITPLPKDGDQVIVRAEMNVWAPKGSYQLVVRELTQVGKGELLLRIEQLKKKLSALGYFSKERKRPLPKSPKTIGIITSPTGAVIRDMLNILSRRMAGFHVIVNPVKVQGDGAAEEIAQAIKEMNRHNLADVLVVCRGGGSFEDLMPFNSELVVTAIFESRIPVVSAVGHETDTTVSDFVADVRAATPSEAAELISHEQEELINRLAKYKNDLTRVLKAKIERARFDFTKCLRHPILTSSTALLAPFWQSLDEVNEDLLASMQRKIVDYRKDLMQLSRSLRHTRPSQKIQENRQILQNLDRQLQQSMQRLLYDKKQKLQKTIALLESIHPKRILAKGYSIVLSQKDGSLISSVSKVEAGEAVRIMVKDGQLEATITKV